MHTIKERDKISFEELTQIMAVFANAREIQETLQRFLTHNIMSYTI